MRTAKETNPIVTDPGIIRGEHNICMPTFESLTEEQRQEVFDIVKLYFEDYKKVFCPVCEPELDGAKVYDPTRNKCLGCFYDVIEAQAKQYKERNGI